jgi:hypothetical protein
VADVLRGKVALDGDNPIVYDAEPTLADRKELATVGYVLDNVTGGTVAFDAQTITGTAGEDVVAGNLVYFKTSDQEWYKTDADTAATVEGVQLGIALGAGSDGVAISGGIQISGTYTTTGLTAGSTYYASNTAGAIATTAGTVPVVVGVALSTTKLMFIPQNNSTNTFVSTSSGASDEGRMPRLNADGQIPLGFLPVRPLDVQEFTTSGTWTKPSQGTYAIIDVLGAGGSGGAGKGTPTVNNVSSAGGGGGAYRQFIIKLSNLSSTETVTIGAGGIAVSVSSADSVLNGNNGGVSWFKNTAMQALGGSGGTSTMGTGTAGGAGGVSAGVLIAEVGGAGGTASHVSSFANAGTAGIFAGSGGGGAYVRDTGTTAASGAGGESLVLAGNGGSGVATIGSENITATSGGAGSGGGGAAKRNATGTATSGAGGDGFARITVF